MKKTILLTTSVLLAAGLQSCSGTREMDNSRLCHISAQTALFGAPQTKTQVGELVGDKLLINWTPGDQIGIVTSNSTVSCFTNQTAEESAYGDFTGLLSGTPTRAFYPYVEGVTDLTAVPFYIPTDQVYTGPESIGLCDVRVATTVNDTPEGYRMHFNSLTCLLRFEVDLTGLEAYEQDFETDEISDEKSLITFGENEIITSIELSAGGDEDPALTCSEENAFLLDLTSENPVLREMPVPLEEATYSTSIIVHVDEDLHVPVAGSDSAVIYAVAAPGAAAGTDFELAVWTQNSSTSHWIFLTGTLAVNLEAGHYYTVPLKASELNLMGTVTCCEFPFVEGNEDGEGGDNIED